MFSSGNVFFNISFLLTGRVVLVKVSTLGDRLGMGYFLALISFKAPGFLSITFS